MQSISSKARRPQTGFYSKPFCHHYEKDLQGEWEMAEHEAAGIATGRNLSQRGKVQATKYFTVVLSSC